MPILCYKTVPGISLFHNCGGGNFSGGTADQFDPPRRARLNLISKNYFINIFYIANSLTEKEPGNSDELLKTIILANFHASPFISPCHSKTD